MGCTTILCASISPVNHPLQGSKLSTTNSVEHYMHGVAKLGKCKLCVETIRQTQEVHLQSELRHREEFLPHQCIAWQTEEILKSVRSWVSLLQLGLKVEHSAHGKCMELLSARPQWTDYSIAWSGMKCCTLPSQPTGYVGVTHHGNPRTAEAEGSNVVRRKQTDCCAMQGRWTICVVDWITSPFKEWCTYFGHAAMWSKML